MHSTASKSLHIQAVNILMSNNIPGHHTPSVATPPSNRRSVTACKCFRTGGPIGHWVILLGTRALIQRNKHNRVVGLGTSVV